MICYLVRLDFSIHDLDAKPAGLVPRALKRITEYFRVSFRRISLRVPNLSKNFFLRHADRNLCRIALVNVTTCGAASRDKANERHQSC